MGLTKYRLQWSDGLELTDLRATTNDKGVHTYEFETGDMNDAKELVRVFQALNQRHNFKNATLTVVEEKK